MRVENTPSVPAFFMSDTSDGMNQRMWAHSSSLRFSLRYVKIPSRTFRKNLPFFSSTRAVTMAFKRSVLEWTRMMTVDRAQHCIHRLTDISTRKTGSLAGWGEQESAPFVARLLQIFFSEGSLDGLYLGRRQLYRNRPRRVGGLLRRSPLRATLLSRR